jgi:ferrochelatase
MPTYLGDTNYEHGAPERIGVLLVNLGTPDAPSAPAVRKFLRQFLSDPRVIEAPRWLWLPVLHGIILRFRPGRSAKAYRQIWTEQGSPLLVYSQALARGLHDSLGKLLHANVHVTLAMSYGNPSIEAGLKELEAAGVRRLLVLPLYPQYSGTTTASVFDCVTRTLQRRRWIPELRFVNDYYTQPSYIHALADSVRNHWRRHERAHLLMSFHGIPKRNLSAGDPYGYQCERTARLLAEALGLREGEWSLSFQSRVGREEWLRPYTDELLAEYAARGPKRITAICPGFATDCLETLEEIALRNREDFLHEGGESFDYVPALNADAAHVEVLTELVLRQAQGWPELSALRDESKLERARGAGG